VPPAVAVRVAACAVLTDAMLAMKPALVEVAGTVIVAGTTTELLLLASATVTPLEGAEPVSTTVQESLSAPVIDKLLQLTELTAGTIEVPVPLRLTATAGALL